MAVSRSFHTLVFLWVGSGVPGDVKIMFYTAESAHGSESWKFIVCSMVIVVKSE